MNEFSMVCRVLGSLWYRHPQNTLLAPLYDLIREDKLAPVWPLEQAALLERLRQNSECDALAAEYNMLFVGEECRVSPFRSAWVGQRDDSEFRQFLTSYHIPAGDGAADHFGALLLAASWLEDNAGERDDEALDTLFADWLLPWCDSFLGKVEAHAETVFWRTMAQLTREAIYAMWEELQENGDELPAD
ncbi:molecular chaperone [Erwinia sp. HR93]|uniref:TorD/DmsD family molecular chaperone n=1 Tax=Erwinia sp. HR93 TaxID=3094840 RepID=UPI002ADEC786|nr:molecular chaperone [Erwinia sp. HR93]MEA1064793.1 molecular chaperone [Erwinia sp. HR93]